MMQILRLAPLNTLRTSFIPTRIPSITNKRELFKAPSSRIRDAIEQASVSCASIRMSSTSSSAPAAAAATSQSSDEKQQAQDSSQPDKLPLGLPEPPSADGPIKLDVSTGESVSLDALGPMVVNKDGTISRIANWDKMAAIEKQNTLRIVGKRNQVRLEALRKQEEERTEA
jgi:hypothetical protein